MAWLTGRILLQMNGEQAIIEADMQASLLGYCVETSTTG